MLFGVDLKNNVNFHQVLSTALRPESCTPPDVCLLDHAPGTVHRSSSVQDHLLVPASYNPLHNTLQSEDIDPRLRRRTGLVLNLPYMCGRGASMARSVQYVLEICSTADIFCGRVPEGGQPILILVLCSTSVHHVGLNVKVLYCVVLHFTCWVHQSRVNDFARHKQRRNSAG